MLSTSRRGVYARYLVSYVIWIAYPAMLLTKLPAFLATQGLRTAMLIPISMPLLQFALASLVVFSLAHWRKLKPTQAGALALTAGLGNTSFLGVPLVRAYFGESGLPLALLTDQGSFLTAAIFGVALASNLSGAPVSLRRSLISVLRFPPFFMSVLCLALAHSEFTTFFESRWFSAIGSTLTPAALLAVALSLNLAGESLRRQWKWVALGLALKLVILPATLAPLYWHWLADAESARLVIFEATMAPMITAAIVADRFDLDREISSLMVSVGIPLSLISTSIWQMGLKSL